MSGLTLLLEAWVHRLPNASALTSTLLQSLWEGAVVALALLIVLVFVRSSRMRYAVSCIAMVALVAGLVVTFMRLAPAQPAGVPLSALVRTGSTGVVRANWIAAPRGAAPAMDPMVWIVPFWIIGVLAFYLRAIAGWISMARIRRTGVCSAPEVWRARVEQLGARLRMTRPVALLESSIAEVPVVVGYLRPVILMPVGLLAGLPVAQVEAILMHELAHIRRFDSLVNLAQVFVEGLLFYHPAVWWISSVIRAERENCCDEIVVHMTGAPQELARALTTLEQRRVFPREALAATGSRLLDRVARLLGRPQPRYAGAVPFMAMVVLTLVAISATAGLQPEQRVHIPAVLPKASLAPTPVTPAPVMIAQAQPAPTQPRVAPPKPESTPPSPPVEPPALPLYKLGPRDVVQVLVFDEPHVTGTYTISAEGDLVFPFTIKIHADGLTIPDLQKEITHQLIEIAGIPQPVVNVQLLRAIPAWIQVIGNVATPMQLKITTPISLYEALAKAGWTTPDAGPKVVVKKPESDVPLQINLDDLQKGDKDPKINLILNGGEIVNVPGKPKVSVTGQVAHPGSVSIERAADATVLKVIAEAGGLTEYYAKTAYIYRLADNGAGEKIPVALKDIMHRKVPDVQLQTGDVLWIPPLDPRSVPPEYYDTRPRLIPVTAEKLL